MRRCRQAPPSRVRVGPVWQWVLRSLSARGSAHVVGLQLSRLLRSFVGLGGPDEWRSLPGQGERRSRRRNGGRGGAGLEWLLAGEDVPGGDQDLARDGGLGGVALAVAVAWCRCRGDARGSSAARPAGRLRRPPSA